MGHVLKQFNISKNMSFTCFRETNKKPYSRRNNNNKPVYKHQVWDNHQGILLLSIAEKSLQEFKSSHLELVIHLELGLLPESQCVFYTDYFCFVPIGGELLGAESWTILLTSWKPLILSTSKACGGSCQSLAACPIHSNGVPIWQHDVQSPGHWRNL